MFRQQKIILVHEDLNTSEHVTAYFRQKNCSITCYQSTEAVLNDCKDGKTDWNFIISDFLSSDIVEEDFKKTVKSISPEASIIRLPHFPIKSKAQEPFVQESFNFLKQDIDFNQLQKLIEMELKNKKEVANSAAAKVNYLYKDIIGQSPAFIAALLVAERVAQSKASIFISGESGTGKEVFANYIHSGNQNKKGKFVAINCSAIPEQLLESELFGHAKGSFTGAIEKKIGLFEEAENGSLFLDEIGDLSLPLQAKLLRVLQERKIRRVGENKFRPINCRIISATHKNIESLIQQNLFREDLFFRLNVIPINLPPLRDRKEDIVPLAQFFLKKICTESHIDRKCFSNEAVQYLMQNSWRGNVRELENSVERAAIMSSKHEITLDNFMPLGSQLKLDKSIETEQVINQNCFSLKCNHETLPSLELVIHKYIEYAVNANNGQRDKTAKEIGIDRKTLYKRIKKEPVVLN
jgi:two-component system, NtrC family, response regulator HydG